mgnify:CR=1 FL=1
MNFFTLKIDKRGRITIPEEIRKILKIKENDLLYIKIENNSIIIHPEKNIEIKMKR